MHFFNPVDRMQLVEVIRGEKTSDETVVTLVALAERIGKTPIVVRDCPGFLVNRILFPYMNEALLLLEEGARAARASTRRRRRSACRWGRSRSTTSSAWTRRCTPGGWSTRPSPTGP